MRPVCTSLPTVNVVQCVNRQLVRKWSQRFWDTCLLADVSCLLGIFSQLRECHIKVVGSDCSPKESQSGGKITFLSQSSVWKITRPLFRLLVKVHMIAAGGMELLGLQALLLAVKDVFRKSGLMRKRYHGFLGIRNQIPVICIFFIEHHLWLWRYTSYALGCHEITVSNCEQTFSVCWIDCQNQNQNSVPMMFDLFQCATCFLWYDKHKSADDYLDFWVYTKRPFSLWPHPGVSSHK